MKNEWAAMKMDQSHCSFHVCSVWELVGRADLETPGACDFYHDTSGCLMSLPSYFKEACLWKPNLQNSFLRLPIIVNSDIDYNTIMTHSEKMKVLSVCSRIS